ncbi:hypothetical protein [Oricola sp.]|uniref:hypothetical protein n=1 Tax=Oricola sp. TaxID=1979950 RepID=UPI003BAA8505
MAVALFANNASSTLASTITAGATTISVQSGDEGKFPSPSGGDWFPVTVVDASGNMEIMRCTARSGVNLTVTRAQESTTAYAFTAGARVELRATAGAFTDLFGNADRITTGAMDPARVSTSANVQTLLGAADNAAFRTSLSVYSKAETDTAIANVVDAAPGALDTLNELAAALGDDANFATTMTNALAGKVAIADEATAAQYRNNTADKWLSTDQVWSAMAEVSLTYAANISWDMGAGVDFTVTLTGNGTLDNPTNVIVGKKGRIRTVQDGTGNRTLSFGSNFVFAGGTAPTLTPTANAEDCLYFDAITATKILITPVLDVS